MTNVTIPLSAYRPGKSAHEVVSAQAADNLFKLDGLDWAVSGDDSTIDWGKRGTRAISHRVNIWGMVSA